MKKSRELLSDETASIAETGMLGMRMVSAETQAVARDLVAITEALDAAGIAPGGKAQTADDGAPVEEPAPDCDWGEAVERAIADAIEVATVRGEGDEKMAYRIARAAIAADRAERGAGLPAAGPVQAIPISECPAEWRDGRWLLGKIGPGKTSWSPVRAINDKWQHIRFADDGREITHVAPLPALPEDGDG